MKRFIVLILITVAVTVVFDACKPKPEDEQPIETGNGRNITITLPADDNILIVDLGDSIAAMQGIVIKNDKGKQITEGIVIEGLDEVGNKELIYTVTESGGKIVQKSRSAIVRADKLLGLYEGDMITRTNFGILSYTVLKNDTNRVAVTIESIWMGGVSYHPAVFIADESIPYTLTFIDDNRDVTQGSSMYAKGRITYGKTDDGFALKMGFLEGYKKSDNQLMVTDTVILERK
jgi:hypothetical protein